MGLQQLTSDQWRHRAHSEAHAIIQETGYTGATSDMVSLVAIGWLQGFNLGAHETLSEAEEAFTRLQAELS